MLRMPTHSNPLSRVQRDDGIRRSHRDVAEIGLDLSKEFAKPMTDEIVARVRQPADELAPALAH
jgi:hypothetical protein